MITLTFSAETYEDLSREARRFAAMFQPVVDSGAAGTPPDVQVDLSKALRDAGMDKARALLTEIFDAQGYEVTIKVKEPLPDGEAPPEPKKRKGGRPPALDQATAAKTLKGNGGKAAKPAFEADAEDDEPENDPEADRQHTLDRLNALHADPKKKPAVKAFADKIAADNNGVKLSALPAAAFPAIRKAMEAEFGPSP